MPRRQYDRRAGHDTDQKHHKNIDAGDTSHQHQQIWDHLNQIVILYDPAFRYIS